MTLSALIRKRDTGNLATAIPAISATQPKGEAATVARIATVAVANPTEAQNDGGNSSRNSNNSSSKPGEQQTRTAWLWLLHFENRNPLEVAFSPEASHAEVLDAYPDALAAEPIEQGRRQPDTLLAGDQEAAILAGLSEIGETDQAIIDEALTRCRQDEDVRRFCGLAGASG